MRIAIIDSGIGGITVFQAIKQKLPLESFIYCSDNAHFPYGEKIASQVIEYTLETTRKVVEKYSPEILVVACSTASTIALEKLRSIYSFPVIGVVPAIKPASEVSTSRVIGLLATNGTINRPYTMDLIQKFAADCVVVRFGSSLLVELAEAKMAGEEISLSILKKELNTFFETPRMDTVVLGCTHFPVLKKELETIAPHILHWLEPGEAIARRVLELSKNLSRNEKPAESFFCYTKETKEIVKTISAIKLKYGFVDGGLVL